MSDLVKRLRKPPFGTETSELNLMRQAADRIEELEAALRKINIGEGWAAQIARAALNKQGETK